MTPFEMFHNAVAYYTTLAHETTHWTSAKTRLAHDLKERSNDEAYAAAELGPNWALPFRARI